MIKPHGSAQLTPLYVEDDAQRAALQKEAETLPKLLVNSATAANAVMLGAGYFTPLKGYMNKADALSVADNMHTSSGLFWPTPVLNLCKDVSEISGHKRIALLDPNVEGNPVVAIQTIDSIEELSQAELDLITEKVYATKDSEHPGVATFTSLGNYIVSGSIEVLNFSYFEKDFPETFRTAVQIRAEIEKLGWNKTVAFQTRNPMHRAHEELCKMAKNRRVLMVC